MGHVVLHPPQYQHLNNLSLLRTLSLILRHHLAGFGDLRLGGGFKEPVFLNFSLNSIELGKP